MTPDELFERVHGGDREAEEYLYSEIRRRMLGMLIRQAGHEDAQDLVQDLYLTLRDAIRFGRVEKPASLWSYANGAARNMIRHLIRKRTAGRQRVVSIDSAPPKAPDQESNLITGERFERMRGELRKMTPLRRRVVEMLCIEDLDRDRVARDLRITIVAVRQHKWRGIAELRRRLTGPEAA